MEHEDLLKVVGLYMWYVFFMSLSSIMQVGLASWISFCFVISHMYQHVFLMLTLRTCIESRIHGKE